MQARDDRPRQTSTTHRVDLDGESVLVDLVSRRGLRLNASALAVWGTCDGVRTVEQIIDEVAAQFHLSPDLIADDVRAAIAELREQRLVWSDRADQACDTAPVIVEDQGTAYLEPGSSPCRRSVDALPWTGTVALAVAGLHVGVRTMSGEVAALVERSFGNLVVADDRVVPNFSVMVDDHGERRGERRHGVYDGHEWRGAAADAYAVMDLLGRRLGALHPTPAGSVRLDVAAARGPAGTALLAGYGQSARFLALRNAGWDIVPGPVLLTPTATGWEADLATGLAAPCAPEPLLGVLVAADDRGPCATALALQVTVPHLWPAPGDDRALLVHLLTALVATAAVQPCPRPFLGAALTSLARHEAIGSGANG
jgi:hypothetical protein